MFWLLCMVLVETVSKDVRNKDINVLNNAVFVLITVAVQAASLSVRIAVQIHCNRALNP